MTRAEHLKWCKDRALAYLPNDTRNAMTSMLSDLGKHSETQRSVELGFMLMMGVTASGSNPDDVRKFIEGFN